MKEKIIEKQDQIIANLKEVGQLYFKIKDKATQQDVARMDSLTTKGRALEAELIALKAQDTPLPPAEGAEEIDELIKKHVPINAANFEFCVKHNLINGFLLQGIRDVATLYAQRIAEKMVEERLREELIAYDRWTSSQKWGVRELLSPETTVNEYLKTRDSHETI